jgi:hypothetical protein
MGLAFCIGAVSDEADWSGEVGTYLARSIGARESYVFLVEQEAFLLQEATGH